MRIIGGTHRGLRLAEVGKGDDLARLRPTPDRVRESLFNILAGYGLPHEARVLDLFAGTGALGLEALSRGASHATFVEMGRVGQRLIRDNLAKSRLAEQATLLTTDARRMPETAVPANLIFLDPPYGKNLGEAALNSSAVGGWTQSGTVAVWEENAPQDVPAGWSLLDHRRYGDSHLTLLERTGEM